MYQDSGLFLREGPASGFAERRVARRMEQGVAPPRAWRSAAGTVLRLPPQRLAELAERVRAIAPPAHPAAADPEAAVVERVAGLARDARPAGTFHDPATGQRLHLFRSGGRWGGWELVTAPPRGALFDIVTVRPARMQGELEVYGAAQYTGGARVRGPHATITWAHTRLDHFLAALNQMQPASMLYIVTRLIGGNDPTNHNLPSQRPRYVGETGNLGQRWQGIPTVLRTFEVDPAEFMIWLAAPLAAATLNFVNAVGADHEALLRRDIEHVLIRRINNALANPHSPVQGAALANVESTGAVLSGPLQGTDISNVVHAPQAALGLPWFLPAQIQVAANVQFELPTPAGILAGLIG